MNEEFVFSSNNLAIVRDAFIEYGFVRVKSAFDDNQIQILTNEIERVESQAATLPENLVWFSPSLLGDEEYVIQRISRINHFSPMINNLGSFDNYLHQLSASLLGVEATRFADGYEGSDGAVLVVKDPNNASVHSSLRWHMDSTFTKHLPINPFVNLGIYLDDAGIEKGGLVVAPRSHRLASAFDTNLAETIEHYADEVCITANRGDLVIHSSDLWHCSRKHTSREGLRRILYFNYFPAPE